MTVMVNLLPREVAVKRAERRSARLTGLLVGLFVVGLGGVHTLKLAEVRQAEEERDVVQADVSRLQAEVASLEQFRQLADELEARNGVLAAAMENEISFARVLNDASLAFPASSSLRSMTLTASAAPVGDAPVDGAAPVISFGDAAATLTFEGYSTERFAPGVESVLVEFDKVANFFNASLATAQVEEIGSTEVTAFQGKNSLDEDAYTDRYADGLPEEVGR